MFTQSSVGSLPQTGRQRREAASPLASFRRSEKLLPHPLEACSRKNVLVSINIYVCERDSVRRSSSYFFTTPDLSTLTGMVVSEDWMARALRGASTVSRPSGERLEVTFSISTVEGRLQGDQVKHTQSGQRSKVEHQRSTPDYH